MTQLRFNFEGMSLKDLRHYRERLITTIGQLKHGLFNAEAAEGLKASIELMTSLYGQITDYYNRTVENLPLVEIDHAIDTQRSV